MTGRWNKIAANFVYRLDSNLLDTQENVAVITTVTRKLPLVVGLILIASLACGRLQGLQEPKEPTWVSVPPSLNVTLVPPDPDQPHSTLIVSSFLGSSSCSKYNYQVQRDGTKIYVTWSQYALVGEEIACTTDRSFAHAVIPLDTGLTPGQLYTVAINGAEIGQFLAR